MFKRGMSLFLGVLFFANPVFASPNSFVVESGYEEAIDYLYDNDIIGSKGNFLPEDSVSKSDFLRLILKNAGYNPANENREIFSTEFKDVERSDWFAPYVFEALEKGLISNGGSFNPERKITRFEALHLFFKLEGIPASLYNSQKNRFSDVPASSRFAPVAATAIRMGLIAPMKQDYFGTMQKITQGEVAEMLYVFEDYKRNFEIVRENGGRDVLSEIPNSDLLLDVWERIHADYYFDEKIDDEKMVYAAIEGMVNSIGDVFSSFMPPAEGESFAESLEGELEGIGAYLAVEEGKIFIVAPLQDSPAEKAGLKPRDQIIGVGGENIEKKALFDVVNLIKGPKGTEVEVTILREGVTKVFTIIRDQIKLKSVSLEKDGDIAVISISQFLSKTNTEFKEVVAQVLEDDMRGIVLDLRSNPGGYLNVSVDILGHFVDEEEKIVGIEYPGIIFEQTSNGPTDLKDIPVVVLINKGSASASEIVAGALQDLGLATIVGVTSYGKGTVQELTVYVNGANLKLTVAKWLTPEGRWIHEIGIVPDRVIEDDENTTEDEQMKEAKRILNSKF